MCACVCASVRVCVVRGVGGGGGGSQYLCLCLCVFVHVALFTPVVGKCVCITSYTVEKAAPPPGSYFRYNYTKMAEEGVGEAPS